MSTWNKKWTCDTNDKSNKVNQLLDKLHELQHEYENPKNIPIFENIYMRPKSSIIEGFNNLEGFGPGEADNEMDEEGVFDDIASKAKENMKRQQQKYNEGVMLNTNLNENLKSNLNGQIEDTLKNLTKFENLGLNGITGALNEASLSDFKETGENIAENFKLPARKIKKAFEEIFGAISKLLNITGTVIVAMGNYVQLSKLYIQQFILEINTVIRDTITKIAHSLTQNSATPKEIDIFQDQTQKFLIMLLVWFFVYNWYYIAFFINDEDEIRYTFDTSKMKINQPYLYGAFGPAIRTVEAFNWFIIGISNFVKRMKVPNSVILFVLFWVFFILVNANFQMDILVNFFNAISGQFAYTTIGFISLIIVIKAAVAWFWGPSKEMKIDFKALKEKGEKKLKASDIPTGHQEMYTWFMGNQKEGFKPSTLPILFFILFLFILYIMWNVAINVPAGLFMISTYLFIYTFFGVFYYEGFNSPNIYTGISSSMGVEDQNLVQESCRVEKVRMFTWAWVYSLPKIIYDYTINGINKIVLSMFEILVILMLLGGIGKYNKEWSASSEGKVQLNPFEPGGMKQTLKHLFLWLIIINILIIVLICMWLYNKFTLLNHINTSNKSCRQLRNV